MLGYGFFSKAKYNSQYLVFSHIFPFQLLRIIGGFAQFDNVSFPPNQIILRNNKDANKKKFQYVTIYSFTHSQRLINTRNTQIQKYEPATS